MVNHRRSIGACLAACVVSALLSGCDLTSVAENRQHLPDAFDTVEKTDLSPRFPQATEQQSAPTRPTAGASYYGLEAQKWKACGTAIRRR